jgi:hypothetical protein
MCVVRYKHYYLKSLYNELRNIMVIFYGEYFFYTRPKLIIYVNITWFSSKKLAIIFRVNFFSIILGDNFYSKKFIILFIRYIYKLYTYNVYIYIYIYIRKIVTSKTKHKVYVRYHYLVNDYNFKGIIKCSSRSKVKEYR